MWLIKDIPLRTNITKSIWCGSNTPMKYLMIKSNENGGVVSKRKERRSGLRM